MEKIRFGTGGYRGVICDTFTREVVEKIAQALATIAIKTHQDDKPIVVGFDNRFMSDYFARWFSEVLNGNGIKVLLYTFALPTPAVMSATKDYENNFGVMITASHNPYFFNGVKVFTKEGYDADVAFTSELEKEINKVKEIKRLPYLEAKSQEMLVEIDDLKPYLAHIKSFISPDIRKNKLRVLYNNLNGVGVIGLEPLSKHLNIYRFDILNEDHDAFFGFNLPNPTKEMLMGEFSEMVLNQSYDLGMASDSDGDRLGIVDERGHYVSPNDILSSLYYYLVKKRGYKGDIVKNCATSILIDLVAKKLGYECHEVDVGFKNITAAMKQYDALIGGESSGGLTMRGYIYGKDASFAGALFMEMVIKEGRPLSQIIKDMKNEVGYHHHFTESSMQLEVEPAKIKEYIMNNTPPFAKEVRKVVHYSNNFKYYFDNDSWVLLRLSGTEPVFRIFAEMENREVTYSFINDIRRYVENAQKEIK